MGLFRPSRIVHAHCDLPCGVYDPAQARIEAESVKAIQDQIKDPSKRKGMGDDETVWLARAAQIKEERAELTKHHLWVLWTDYFKPEHKEKFPELHETFWKATKAAGEAKHSEDPTTGQALLDQIAEIDKVFWETKK